MYCSSKAFAKHSLALAVSSSLGSRVSPSFCFHVLAHHKVTRNVNTSFAKHFEHLLYIFLFHIITCYGIS